MVPCRAGALHAQSQTGNSQMRATGDDGRAIGRESQAEGCGKRMWVVGWPEMF